MDFDGRVILITGAASGVGAAAAYHLSKLGAKLSMVDRDKKALYIVAEQLMKLKSPDLLTIVADVTTDARQIVDATIKHFGQLDVLINSAAIAIKDSVDNAKTSDFYRVLDTNVRSVITLTKLCVPYLEKTKGNVVNVSSANCPAQNNLTFCISKAALDQFTKCSALDLTPKQIRVNSINPTKRISVFDTFGVNSQTSEIMLQEYRKKYPIGRIDDVTETSTAIAYLAYGSSISFLTGILLPIDERFSLSGNRI